MFIICFLYVGNHLWSFSSLSIEAEGLSRTRSSAVWLISLTRLLWESSVSAFWGWSYSGGITPPWCVCGVCRSERQSSCLHDKSFNSEPSTQLHKFLLNFLSSCINYTEQLALPWSFLACIIYILIESSLSLSLSPPASSTATFLLFLWFVSWFLMNPWVSLGLVTGAWAT